MSAATRLCRGANQTRRALDSGTRPVPARASEGFASARHAQGSRHTRRVDAFLGVVRERGRRRALIDRYAPLFRVLVPVDEDAGEGNVVAATHPVVVRK